MAFTGESRALPEEARGRSSSGWTDPVSLDLKLPHHYAHPSIDWRAATARTGRVRPPAKSPRMAPEPHRRRGPRRTAGSPRRFHVHDEDPIGSKALHHRRRQLLGADHQHASPRISAMPTFQSCSSGYPRAQKSRCRPSQGAYRLRSRPSTFGGRRSSAPTSMSAAAGLRWLSRRSDDRGNR